MSFLGLENYTDQFEGKNKTVFRDPELIYTTNPEDMMKVIMDDDWYDQSKLQLEVWDHNLQQIKDAGIPLSYEEYVKDTMICEITDERIDGHIASPALVISDYDEIQPYNTRTTFDDLTRKQTYDIEWMQEELSELIENGEIAVQERELAKTDYHGAGCLRQWGENQEGEAILLEFGEYHHQIEGPYTGQEFLEEHNLTAESSHNYQHIILD